MLGLTRFIDPQLNPINRVGTFVLFLGWSDVPHQRPFPTYGTTDDRADEVNDGVSQRRLVTRTYRVTSDPETRHPRQQWCREMYLGHCRGTKLKFNGEKKVV